ncbi:hypothetical protein TSUD_246750 [Trifolium subterraneum]|uniref:Uncharacterized protein n=1 Tax=Trifolium subterraneum TaxID=3900 RepID=A0A2Z6NQS3_TRISU|nr:hypothetical protein TSUD_246750 [Trifolium subterraneum]
MYQKEDKGFEGMKYRVIQAIVLNCNCGYTTNFEIVAKCGQMRPTAANLFYAFTSSFQWHIPMKIT